MLKEEQAAELLRRCEAIAGRTLHQVRGNLRRAKTRAEAVWELLVVEAAAQLGAVECERPEGGPDLRLQMPTGRWVAIEVTYLHPRFAREERLSEMVAQWMHDASLALGPDAPHIECQFHGDKDNPAGPVRRLPREQDRKRFLTSPEVIAFLRLAQQRPEEAHRVTLTDYTITLRSSPGLGRAKDILHWGGLSQESPKIVGEHAAFRSLRAKMKQHKVDGPHLVCIGSDVSSMLSSTFAGLMGVRLEHALDAAIGGAGTLSGVLTVRIEHTLPLSDGVRRAFSTAFPVATARHPLDPEEWDFIRRLDLNRWAFTWPLPDRGRDPIAGMRYINGSISHCHHGGNLKLTIPTNVLLESLSGKRSLVDAYNLTKDEALAKYLSQDWSIVKCSLQEDDLQKGLASSIVLELGPPHEAVYWPRK